jgi:hypothetical protein
LSIGIEITQARTQLQSTTCHSGRLAAQMPTASPTAQRSLSALEKRSRPCARTRCSQSPRHAAGVPACTAGPVHAACRVRSAASVRGSARITCAQSVSEGGGLDGEAGIWRSHGPRQRDHQARRTRLRCRSPACVRAPRAARARGGTASDAPSASQAQTSEGFGRGERGWARRTSTCPWRTMRRSLLPSCRRSPCRWQRTSSSRKSSSS